MGNSSTMQPLFAVTVDESTLIGGVTPCRLINDNSHFFQLSLFTTFQGISDHLLLPDSSLECEEDSPSQVPAHLSLNSSDTSVFKMFLSSQLLPKADREI